MSGLFPSLGTHQTRPTNYRSYGSLCDPTCIVENDRIVTLDHDLNRYPFQASLDSEARGKETLGT